MPLTVGELIDALEQHPLDAVVVFPVAGLLFHGYRTPRGVVRPLCVYPHVSGDRHLYTTDAARAADLMCEPAHAVEIS